jgi:hypothetical protein
VRLVTVVFHDDYSEKLEKLAFRTPVWIVDTPANRQAAEGAWHEAVHWPHISVTLFRFDDWPSLIEQVAFQFRSVAGIDVIGTQLTLPARAALDAAGFSRYDETAEGFRARKG